jgi:anti-anti-sigma factor
MSGMLQILHKKALVWIIPLIQITKDNFTVFEQEIESALSGIADRVVLDFSKIEYLHSSTIKLMIHLQREIIVKGGSFFIVNMSHACKGILKSVRLDKVFRIFDTEEEFFGSTERSSGK